MRRLIVVGIGLACLLAGAATALGIPQRLANTPGTAASPDFACSVKPSCDVGEVEVLRMSSLTNAHAGLPAASAYGNTICCSGLAGLGTDCTGTHDAVLALSGLDNAHVASDGSYANEACLSLEGEGIVDCAAAADCDEGHQCLATISAVTNAHIADCGVEAYGTKVCCQALPDNCPDEGNPDQSNIDQDDSGGDVCDPCPNDPDDACDTERSAGETIGPAGGSITTPDNSVHVTVPAGALSEDTSISITGDIGTGLALTTNKGWAQTVFQVDMQPAGQGFDPPATIEFTWDDANDDGRVDGTSIREKNLRIVKDGVVLAGPCKDVPLQCDQDLNTFTFTVDSFSHVVLAAPEDTDDDEVPDNWDGVRDNCPGVPNEDQADGDHEGLGDACDPCDDDPDCDDDEFTDFQERYMGTDLLDACPDNPSHDAWPVDTDVNTTINVLDLFEFVLAEVMGTRWGEPNYSARFDLTADGSINVLDLFEYVRLALIGAACTNQ